MPPKHGKSILRTYDHSNLSLLPVKNAYMAISKKKKPQLVPNFGLLQNETINSKYFILDHEDFVKVGVLNGNSVEPQPDKEVYLQNLTEYVKFDKKKKIYIRQLPGDDGLFFFCEILEVIPIVLMQQNTPINSHNELLKKFEKMWPGVDSKLISKAEVNRYLEEFDVNKNLITIVQDLEQRGSFQEHRQHMVQTIYSLNPKGLKVQFKSQAIYELFVKGICGVNWKIKRSETNMRRIISHKKNFIYFMSKMNEVDENSLLLCDNVEKLRETMKIYPELFNDPESHFLTLLGFMDNAPFYNYTEIVKTNELKCPDLSWYEDNEYVMPVWLMRVMCMCGWIANFFYLFENRMLKETIMNELMSIVPKEHILVAKPLLEDIASGIDNRFKLKEIMEALNKGNKKIVHKKKKTTRMNEDNQIWEEYSKKLEFHEDALSFDKSWYSLVSDEETYVPNYYYLELGEWGQLRPQPFVLAKRDFEMAFIKGATKNHLKSLTTFCENFEVSKFVIRFISIPEISFEKKYVLVAEVLEMIPLIMRRQGVSTDDYQDFLLEFTKKHGSQTMELWKTKQLLCELNVPKDLIVIIQDAHSEHMAFILPYNIYPYIFNFDEKGDQVITPERAFLYMFESIVCGVNWEGMNKKKLESFEEQFTAILKWLSRDTFVSMKNVERKICSMKEHEVFKGRTDYQDEYFKFPSTSYESFITWKKYADMCVKYGIKVYNKQQRKIKVRMANILLIVGWIKFFYGEPEPIPAVYFLTTELIHNKSQLKDFNNRLNASTGLIDWITDTPTKNNVLRTISDALFVQEKTYEDIILDQDDDDVVLREEEYEALAESIAEQSSGNSFSNTSSGIYLNEASFPESNVLGETKKNSAESKLCSKCTRNGKKLQEAQDSLKKAEIKSTMYEKKALKSIENEKNMKKMKKETEDLFKKNQKFTDEIDVLNTNMAELKEKDKKHQEEIDSLKYQLDSEQQNNLNNQQEKAMLTQKIEQMQLNFALKLSRLEEEIVEKNNKIHKLSRALSQKPLTFSCFPELSKSPEKAISSMPPPGTTFNSDESERSSRWHLIKWWKYKDDLGRDSVLEKQKAMLEKRISALNEGEEKRHAEYELTRLEGTLDVYLKIVEINIQKIKKTDDFSNLLPLPEYPALAPDYLEMFDQEMLSELNLSLESPGVPSEPSTSSQGFSLVDKEFDPKFQCYICYEEFEEGVKTVICKGCSKPVHIECGERWSKAQTEIAAKQSSCGYCRRRMEIKKENNMKK